jgi:hypothetical protein
MNLEAPYFSSLAQHGKETHEFSSAGSPEWSLLISVLALVVSPAGVRTSLTRTPSICFEVVALGPCGRNHALDVDAKRFRLRDISGGQGDTEKSSFHAHQCVSLRKIGDQNAVMFASPSLARTHSA